jgi:hypothetical protein
MIDLVFDRQHFPGELAVVPSRALTKRSLVGDWKPAESEQLRLEVSCPAWLSCGGAVPRPGGDRLVAHQALTARWPCPADPRG